MNILIRKNLCYHQTINPEFQEWNWNRGKWRVPLLFLIHYKYYKIQSNEWRLGFLTQRSVLTKSFWFILVFMIETRNWYFKHVPILCSIVYYIFPFEKDSPFFEPLNRIILTLLASIVTMSVCFARGFGQIQNFNKGSQIRFFAPGPRYDGTKKRTTTFVNIFNQRDFHFNLDRI